MLIGTALKQANEEQVAGAIAGYGIALDADAARAAGRVQKSRATLGKAKAFDVSCPISGFILAAEFGDPQRVALSLAVSDKLRQQGNTREMITPIMPLIAYMSRFFTLREGDIVFTGTPQGVVSLVVRDSLKVSLNGMVLTTRVI